MYLFRATWLIDRTVFVFSSKCGNQPAKNTSILLLSTITPYLQQKCHSGADKWPSQEQISSSAHYQKKNTVGISTSHRTAFHLSGLVWDRMLSLFPSELIRPAYFAFINCLLTSLSALTRPHASPIPIISRSPTKPNHLARPVPVDSDSDSDAPGK